MFMNIVWSLFEALNIYFPVEDSYLLDNSVEKGTTKPQR